MFCVFVSPVSSISCSIRFAWNGFKDNPFKWFFWIYIGKTTVSSTWISEGFCVSSSLSSVCKSVENACGGVLLPLHWKTEGPDLTKLYTTLAEYPEVLHEFPVQKWRFYAVDIDQKKNRIDGRALGNPTTHFCWDWELILNLNNFRFSGTE